MCLHITHETSSYKLHVLIIVFLDYVPIYECVCVCVCVYIYIYIYILYTVVLEKMNNFTVCVCTYVLAYVGGSCIT